MVVPLVCHIVVLALCGLCQAASSFVVPGSIIVRPLCRCVAGMPPTRRAVIVPPLCAGVVVSSGIKRDAIPIIKNHDAQSLIRWIHVLILEASRQVHVVSCR